MAPQQTAINTSLVVITLHTAHHSQNTPHAHIFSQVSRLPDEFLSTPLGAMMKPLIEGFYKKMGGGFAPVGGSGGAGGGGMGGGGGAGW
jgi:hypothetical protein